MFIIHNTNCLLSYKLFTSSANDDIVVKDPQKPIAKKNEYLGSRFHVIDKTENIPKIELPIILLLKRLMEVLLILQVEILQFYIKNAPQTAPIPRRRNSKPFIIENSDNLMRL